MGTPGCPIDYRYEYDAPRFYDFERINVEDDIPADAWFETQATAGEVLG